MKSAPAMENLARNLEVLQRNPQEDLHASVAAGVLIAGYLLGIVTALGMNAALYGLSMRLFYSLLSWADVAYFMTSIVLHH